MYLLIYVIIDFIQKFNETEIKQKKIKCRITWIITLFKIQII